MQPTIPKDVLSDLKGNKFKASPSFTKQITTKTELDITFNNLLNSLFTRRHFTDTSKNTSFKLKGINISGDSSVIAEDGLPLQVLCLFINQPNSRGSEVFKNFTSANQGYIKNGVINPARLSDFWFGHQNIVRLEYLSGYQRVAHTFASVEESGTGAILQANVKNRKRLYTNYKKPQWRLLKPGIFDSLAPGEKILCRLVRYEDGTINKKMVKSFDMPLINSYFTLTGGDIVSGE